VDYESARDRGPRERTDDHLTFESKQKRLLMATIICSHCSAIVTVDGPLPEVCPTCGKTLRIEGDETHTGAHLPSTVVQVPEQRPASLGRYIVLKRLGGGGFGSVFQARDPELDVVVAIKVPRRDTGTTPQALERFAREGRNAAQLRHPGIVSVYNVGNEGGLPYIVCEYVEGETLADRLREGPVLVRAAAQIVADVADALEYAHAHNIIHRDIKPSNIMLCPDGKPRLMDFGLAKRDVDLTITRPHSVIGTPAYMSPEQAWGGKRGPVDERSDVYSLGTVLYHLLTGDFPFHGEPRMVMRQVIEDEPKAPRKLNIEIPVDLEVICQKAMRKEPAARYQTAGALAKDLQHWLDGRPIEARPVAKLERAWSWCRRNPAAAGLIATIALLLVSVAGGGALLAAVEANARNKAEDLLTENRTLLSKSYLERADRHLHAEGPKEPYSVIKALPWFYAALRLDEQNPLRRDAGRLRLGAALRAAPSVEKIWWHGKPINCAAISPAEDRFFTGGRDGTGRLWDVEKGEVRKPDLVHPASLTSAQFSPDAKLLLTGCQDGAARLWDVESGKLVVGPLRDDDLVKQQNAPIIQVVRVSFSPSGRRFATVREGTIQIWLTATGKPVGTRFVSRRSFVASAEFADDEQTLLVSALDSSFWTVDVQSGKSKGQLPRSEGPTFAHSVAVSPDQTTIAAMANARSVVFYDRKTGNRLNKLELAHEGAVTVLRSAPDGRTLATGTKDGAVYLWNMSDGKQIWKRRLAAGEIRFIDFGGPTEPLLVHTTVVPGIYALDVPSGELAAEPVLLPTEIKFPTRMRKSGRVATATNDGLVRLWRLEEDDPALVLPHSHRIEQATVSTDRRTLATLDQNDLCCVLTTNGDGRFENGEAKIFSSGLAKPLALALSADGTVMAVADWKSVLATFDISSKPRLLARMETSAPVVAMAFAPRGGQLLTCSKDGQVAAWNAQSGERIHVEQAVASFSSGKQNFIFPSTIQIAFGSKRDLCVIANGHELVMLNPLTGDRLAAPVTHSSRFELCRLSRDERFVLTACSDYRARLWDVASAKLVAATPDAQRSMLAIEFSPDGSLFATGSADGIARVWRTVDASPVGTPCAIDNFVTQLLFSPSGRYLATTSFDNRDLTHATTLRAWDTLSGDCVLVRSIARLVRRFSPDSDGLIPEPSEAVCLFFSADADRLQLVTRGRVVVSYDLWPDSRSSGRLLEQVDLRSGLRPDSQGGLFVVDPDQLVSDHRADHGP